MPGTECVYSGLTLSLDIYQTACNTHRFNVSRFWHETRLSCRFRPEAEHSANAGLHIARELLEPIKKKYPGISYSDLWTLAGCVAVEEMGGGASLASQGCVQMSHI